MAGGINLFGFTIKKTEEEEKILPTPVVPNIEDGAINIQSGSHYGIYVDLDGSYRSETDLITKYRTMAMQPEMENAIDDIVDEAIVHSEDDEIVKIEMDELKQPDNIKKLIRDEFDELLRMLDFNNGGSDLFRRWYIDGRMYYHVVIDPNNPRDGIKELIFIDPRRIRKVRHITKKKNEKGVEIIDRIDTFYIYNEKLTQNNAQNPQIMGNFAGGIKLSEDSVINITSGLVDPNKSTVLSYLHKAIRPMNQLRFIEDATVIYKVSRAPERRVFYVDVGNMPKIKAEQYLKDIMTKFRNKLTYDASTGEVRDTTKHLSMLEDFWMPRRGEGKATEITTLPAGQGFDNMDGVLYFEKKLYKALGVPVSRLESQTGFSLGRSSEITRDELKFDKFVSRLRSKFAILFDELLSRQLTLKGVCTLEEWKEFKQFIRYDFIKDNNFTELKEAELLQNRLNNLSVIDAFVGRYFSKEWVMHNVLRFDEEETEEMEEQMDKENKEMEKEAKKAMAQGQPAQPEGGPTQPGQPMPSPQQGPPQNAEELNQRVEKELK